MNATDLQRLTLSAADVGARFAGHYAVHHPTIHVEGPTSGGIRVMRQLNASLDMHRRAR